MTFVANDNPRKTAEIREDEELGRATLDAYGYTTTRLTPREAIARIRTGYAPVKAIAQ